jgi:hypothetical protein
MPEESCGRGRAWALPVYGCLVGALFGLALGRLAWQLFAKHSDPFCVALTAGGTRCSGGTAPDRWTFTTGAICTAAGLMVGLALLMRSRRRYAGATTRSAVATAALRDRDTSAPNKGRDDLFEVNHPVSPERALGCPFPAAPRARPSAPADAGECRSSTR